MSLNVGVFKIRETYFKISQHLRDMEMFKSRQKLFFLILFSLAVNLVTLGVPQDLPAQEFDRELKKGLSSKKWADVEGFRSARFGMDEEEVLRAIRVDFHVPITDVVRKVHPVEKTMRLAIKVSDLLPKSGPAQVVYLFGFRTVKLIEVDIFWGPSSISEASSNDILSTARILLHHFQQQKFQKEGLVINGTLPDGSFLVFRGKDLKGRMIILHYLGSEKEKSPSKKTAPVLRLSYIEKPNSPDIFKLKEGEF